MKFLVPLLAVAALVACHTVPALADEPASDPNPSPMVQADAPDPVVDYADPATVREAQAIALLDRLDAGEYESARELFDDAMSNALSAAQLGQVWESLPAQIGEFRGRGELRHMTTGAYETVIIPLTYGDTVLDANVTFDDQQRIAGFQVTPAATPATE